MIKSINKIFPKNIYRHILYPRIQPFLLFIKKREGNSILEKEYIKKLFRYKINWQSQNNNVVLTQIISDHAYCIKLAACASFIAKKESSNIGLYDSESRIEWNRGFNFNSWNYFLLKSLLLVWISCFCHLPER